MKRYLPTLSAAVFFGASSLALAASATPAQAPDVPGNAGGGPVDCTQVPTDRNCVSANPKNDSNSSAARRSKNKDSADPYASRDGTGTMSSDSNKRSRSKSGSSGSTGSTSGTAEPQNANETPGPAGRSNDRVQ